MSKVQPTQRPGARRPGAAPQAAPAAAGSTSGFTKRSDEEVAKLRALSVSEDGGTAVDLDPSEASAGYLSDETATIVGAKLETRTWVRKDGSIPENAVPDISLTISFKRDGDEPEDKPFREQYRYGNFSLHVPSTDGNKLNVRPSAMKPGQKAPAPRKLDPGVLFLTSIRNAGGTNIIDAVKKDGVKALAGLRCHVRRQRVEGMSERAKDVLLVDFIEGVSKPGVVAAPAAQAPAAAPVAQHVQAAQAPAATVVAPEVSGITALAEEALLDILASSADGKISRSQIPTTVIRIDKWKSHPERGAILKALRDDVFVNSQKDILWAVEGNDIKKL